jgi:Ca-activated chloride channel homolog
MKHILLGVSLFVFGIATSNAQVPKAKMIIILDASGSMVQKIKGKRSKIEIAKEVVGTLVRNLDPNIEVGFMVYGHRAKGDCSDIELMVPPIGSNADLILSQLNKIQPKGRTPICASVEKAAEELRYTEDKASVVVVTDGEETCGGDPCALGKKLKEKGIDFKAHIVGFGLENGEGAGLKCLADATGGLFVEARSAESLTAALNTAVERVVESRPVSAPVPPPVSTPTPGAPANAATLKASAYQTQGGEPINKDVSWVLTPGDSPTVVERSYDAVWNAAIPPGQYQLQIEHGSAKATVPIKIEAGKVLDQRIVLGSGTVKASAVMKEGGPLVEKEVAWEIGTVDSEGEFNRIAVSYDGQPSFVVPAGNYRVNCKRGQASAGVDVAVESGQTATKTVILKAGVLDPVAALPEGTQPKEIAWHILGAANEEGERDKIAVSYDAKPRFYLPAGKYLVTWEGTKDKGSAEVELIAGELKKLDIPASQ